MLPVTPCSRGSTDFSLCNAERRNRTSNDRLGRLIYSQEQCHSASSAILRSCSYLVVKKQKERVLSALNAQKRSAPLSQLIELVLRFRERESAPAGSTPVSQIIGELVFCRSRDTYGIHVSQRTDA